MMKNKTAQFLKLGYQVPDHYMRDSKEKMLKHILMPAQEHPGVRPLWKKLTEVAAILVLLLATQWSIENFQLFSVSKSSDDYDALLIESISINDEDFDLWFEENYVLNIL